MHLGANVIGIDPQNTPRLIDVGREELRYSVRVWSDPSAKPVCKSKGHQSQILPSSHFATRELKGAYHNSFLPQEPRADDSELVSLHT